MGFRSEKMMEMFRKEIPDKWDYIDSPEAERVLMTVERKKPQCEWFWVAGEQEALTAKPIQRLAFELGLVAYRYHFDGADYVGYVSVMDFQFIEDALKAEMATLQETRDYLAGEKQVVRDMVLMQAHHQAMKDVFKKKG